MTLLGSAAGTDLAGVHGREGDLDIGAEGGIDQTDFRPNQDVAPTGGTAPGPTSKHRAIAKHRTQEIVEPAKAGEQI